MPSLEQQRNVMKRIATNSIVLLLALTLPAPLSAKTNANDCSKPAVLHVSKIGNDLYYQLDQHQQHKLFTLGEVSDAVRSCTPDRMIFVVADPSVSPMEMLLPAKEQITSVRYFVQFHGGDVIELSFGMSFPKLPLTPDVKGIPFYDDEPPLPTTKITRGSN
jgi:hypothetical protein